MEVVRYVNMKQCNSGFVTGSVLSSVRFILSILALKNKQTNKKKDNFRLGGFFMSALKLAPCIFFPAQSDRCPSMLLLACCAILGRIRSAHQADFKAYCS